jgi:hypothetical protein
MKHNRPVGRNEGLVVQPLNGEILIYDLRKNRALCLNETSALIWELCDGTRDVKALRDAAAVRIGEGTTEDLVWLALDQLKREDLVDNVERLKGAGVTRRTVLTAIGIAAIQMPAIAAVAPKGPAAAVSICGKSCNSDNDCLPSINCPSCFNPSGSGLNKTCNSSL